ncbi:hypothetical protein [Chromobacterium violaceum]|uniref:hypothetical protein n=1 Tax=Chromobacterium violaceum TaxID=536 RepID=UPI0015956236|nr:hypothetical protein [Chromobacterium violaceum]MBA8735956.1 hypothetical protein [Chromobacterium violaceum]
MASYAPASMKPAPETALQLAKSGGLAAADDVGASDHVHCFPFWIGAERATNEKGALRRLCWVAGESPGWLPFPFRIGMRQPGALGQAAVAMVLENLHAFGILVAGHGWASFESIHS